MREQADERKARIDSLTSDLAAFETAPAQSASKAPAESASKAPSAPAQQQDEVASNDATDSQADGAGSEESER